MSLTRLSCRWPQVSSAGRTPTQRAALATFELRGESTNSQLAATACPAGARPSPLSFSPAAAHAAVYS